MNSLENENTQQVYDDWDVYAKEFFNTDVNEYAQELSKCF
jgi:hypothetical protein